VMPRISRMLPAVAAGCAVCCRTRVKGEPPKLSYLARFGPGWRETKDRPNRRSFQQIQSGISSRIGPAVAGGAGLVSVCDLAVSAQEARFGYPEVRRGLVAAMVMPHLLRHVGERVARHLLLTGELIDAAAAVAAGFINEVVAAERLMPRANELARSLAEGGPQALAATKELLHRFSRQSVSVEEAAKASAAPRLGEECRQGLRAFFEKRPAPWSPQ